MIEEQNKYFIKDKPDGSLVIATLRHAWWWWNSLIGRIRLDLSHPAICEKKYKVSVCAIFKNEAPYIREWIEFNHLVGIAHFYMYNNQSDDNFREILEPYIKRGWVTLIDWPFSQKQMEAYVDCITKYSSETKWLGFIDLDEYIVPKNVDNIYDFLKRFEKNRGSVNIYWKLYGTSGLMKRDINGLVTEDFIVCWPKYCDIGKCFYNTAYDFDTKSKHVDGLHHKFWANWKGHDIPPVNIFNRVCTGNRNIALEEDFPIQINHYFTKSFEEYSAKRVKGDVYFTINPHDEAYFYEHEMKCTSADYSAYKFLNKLKISMEMRDDL